MSKTEKNKNVKRKTNSIKLNQKLSIESNMSKDDLIEITTHVFAKEFQSLEFSEEYAAFRRQETVFAHAFLINLLRA